MSVFGLNWQFNWVARYGQVALSPRERDRLRALSLWQETQDVPLACRTFGVSRATHEIASAEAGCLRGRKWDHRTILLRNERTRGVPPPGA